MLAFLGCYPLSLLIPPAWGWENGVVENAQVLVLLGGCLLAWMAARRLGAGPARVLAWCTMPVWLLLSGRELSWGAVFLPPIGFDVTGPIYASRILWYRPLVVPVAAVILALVLYVGWRHRLDRLLKGTIVRRRVPWAALAILVASALASTFAEGHLYPFSGFSFKQGEVYEELVELVGYLALVLAQLQVFAAAGERVGPGATAPVDRDAR